jgi:phosphatidylserine/phosphatidylglycerophosphate/cardiolipin synthase-like enzyme
VVEPDAGMAPVYAAIQGADSSIDLVMYELEDQQAESLLVGAEGRGVSVRVILDQAYARSENQAAYAYLDGHGVAVHWSSTQVDITHQKTMVVDGRTAYIMTGNLTSQYYSSTRDFTVVDTDPADLDAITHTFDADFDGAATMPSPGDDLVWSPGAASPLLAVINGAATRLLVENEEMSDSAIVSALAAAARRGVGVEVCMTDSSSWSSEFATLAAAGVQIRTYAPNAPLYIHAKVILADPGSAGATVFIGSQNFSSTSLTENRELGVILHAPSVIAAIAPVLEQDLSGGTPTS